MRFTFFFGGGFVSPDAEKILQIQYVAGYCTYVKARSCWGGWLIEYFFYRDDDNNITHAVKIIDGAVYVWTPVYDEDGFIEDWIEYNPDTRYPVGIAQIGVTLVVY